MNARKAGRFWRGKNNGKAALFTSRLEALLFSHGYGTDQAAELRYIMGGKRINEIEKELEKGRRK